MDDLTFEHVDASHPSARWVMSEFFGELDRRFPAGYDGSTALAEAPLTLSPPHGVYVVLMRDEQCLGGGGVHWLDDERAEIKRVWIAPDGRGHGLAGRLMQHLEELVLDSGRTSVVLDTNGVLAEALALYGRLGYHAIERYNDNPYATNWFARTLTPYRG